MKKVWMITLMAGLAFGFQACEEADPCDTITCANGGTCDDGECDCLIGYEGDDCSTLTRNKYVGTYNVAEVCPGTIDAYSSTISAAVTSDKEFLIGNFYNVFTNPVVARVSGSNTFAINAQEPDGDGVTVSGSGSIDAGGIVVMAYTISNGGAPDNCTAEFTPN